MNQEYADITSRLGRPLWWDEVGVPRYWPFQPSLCNNIYADEVCLLRIGCQGCEEEFLVAMSWDRTDGILYKHPTLTERVEAKMIHYGDPPHHDDPAGNTENCEDYEVVEFWVRDRVKWSGWQRAPELEIVLQEE